MEVLLAHDTSKLSDSKSSNPHVIPILPTDTGASNPSTM